MNVVKLTNDKLSVGSIYESVCSPEFGAVSLFVGTTRNNFEGKTVMKLEYEAYEQMAVKSLLQLCGNIRKNYQVGNIAIYHRLGNVPIQEASVVIAISSTHRQSALEAVPYAIDALKAEIPIWKKEIYADEHPPEWKENSEWKQSFTSADGTSNCHLYEEEVEMDVGNEVPSHLIQVKANLNEINRRIDSFIRRKREQINASNIQNFLSGAAEDAAENTCARVSAVLKRRTGSKGHLKVRRVANAIGPQTQGPGVRAAAGTGIGDSCPPGAEERIANAETHLGLSPRSKTADVFSRLKAIEDRILFLESISPEYFDPRKQEPKAMHNRTSCLTKRKYTFSDLDTKMKQLEAKLLEKEQKRK